MTERPEGGSLGIKSLSAFYNYTQGVKERKEEEEEEKKNNRKDGCGHVPFLLPMSIG